MSSPSDLTLQNSTNVSQKKKRKKIVIRSYKTPPQVPANFYEKESQLVLKSILSLLKKENNNSNSSNSLQQAHGRVLDLVKLQYGPRLYTDLVDSLQQACEIILPSSTHETVLLTTIPSFYTQFLDYLSVVRHVCMPLDRQYVYHVEKQEALLRTSTNTTTTTHNNKDTRSLWQVGLYVFSQRLQQLNLHQQLYQAWWNALWNVSYQENSASNQAQLQECIMLWKELGLASSILQHDLQPQLIQHLQYESQRYNTMTSEEFVQFVHSKWNLMSQTWACFLPKVWLRGLLQTHLLQPNFQDILDKLTIDNIQHVHCLYGMTSRQDQPRIIAQIATCSLARGRAILERSNTTSIVGLLQLQSQLMLLEKTLETSLNLKHIFATLLQDSSTAQALAKHVDGALKSTKTTPNLQSLLQLFCHLSAKDVFEAFYKRDLAKRLLSGRVQNMDMERQFVSLLKSECGAGYTCKMEGMFQDVEWSRELMQRYVTAKSSETVELTVQVLTTGYWPVYPNYTLNLPTALQVSQAEFEEFYVKTHQGRRIAWQYSLGHVTLKAQFGKKQYDFVLNLSLALVLLCFNDKDKWTLAELQQQVGLTDREEMERILMTLSLGKIKLLQKWDYDAKPGQKPRPNVDPQDVFTVHVDFFSPSKRIKVSCIAKSDANKEEREKTMDMVSRDRLYLLDAVLVRILKARKTMLHSELIPLVMEHAKVPVTPIDVKSRIESLMDREYLERDKDDRNRYNYLA